MSNAKTKVIERLVSNADQIIERYARSDVLLRDAVQEAAAWVPGLVSGMSFPKPHQLERLCTQLLAIVIVSEPGYSDAPKPAVKYGVDEKRGVVWELS